MSRAPLSRVPRRTGDVPLRARALAPAKINLGLFVGPRRECDGRHELVSVMQSISLADELTLESIESAPGEAEDVLDCPGVPGDPRENLAMRALRVYREATGWDAGPLRLSIHKRIPVAAGLGGGSADAAATLRLAHHLAEGGGASGAHGKRAWSGPSSTEGPRAASRTLDEERPDELLLELAATLGADVPAQVAPGRWLATGAGERLRALPAPVRPFGVLVLPIAAQLSTAEVYARVDELGVLHTRESLMELAAELGRELAAGAELPVARELWLNELQTPAMALCPQIAPTLRLAQEAGPADASGPADAAFVSGSGPTVIAVFLGAAGASGEGPERARAAAERLSGRTPPAIWALPVDAAFGRATDFPVRHNHDR